MPYQIYIYIYDCIPSVYPISNFVIVNLFLLLAISFASGFIECKSLEHLLFLLHFVD